MNALLGWLLLGTWVTGVWAVLNLVREMRAAVHNLRPSSRTRTRP